MLRSLQTSVSRPSFARRRLTPPTSTPSVVESMNVVLREVDDHPAFAPLRDHLEELLLELGRRVEVDLACERDRRRRVSESCSVLMSKFMMSPPQVANGRSLASLVVLPAAVAALLRLQLP